MEMEYPIQVAVRVNSDFSEEFSRQPSHVKIVPQTSGVQVDDKYFPVTHALPLYCNQEMVFDQTVMPMIDMFLEGFDSSIVVYGQKSTGKTFTMFGPGFNFVHGESTEHGVVQRFCREIFLQLTQLRDRNYIINITWIEIIGNTIINDLLETGSVQCLNINDIFHWLQIGTNNRSLNECHNIFTLTLEQHWISPDGLIQHRLSTASFCDLCSTERIFVADRLQQHVSFPKDVGLQALESIVNELIDPNLMSGGNHHIQYNQTILTTLVKDSFGGRARTLFILCVSPLKHNVLETLHNLQFSFKVQCVRNLISLNAYSDNNTPIPTIESIVGTRHVIDGNNGTVAVINNINNNNNINNTCKNNVSQINCFDNQDNFGLKFAASQWSKLVVNAEELFTKLIENNKSMNDKDRECIEEWMFLKQEFEECLNSDDIHYDSNRHLVPIQETDEPTEELSSNESDKSCNKRDSDELNEDNNEGKHDNCDEDSSNNDEECDDYRITNENDYGKMCTVMKELHMKSSTGGKRAISERSNGKLIISDNDTTETESGTPLSIKGRRKSLQPGLSLSSIELAMLNDVANRKNRELTEFTDPEETSKALVPYTPSTTTTTTAVTTTPATICTSAATTLDLPDFSAIDRNNPNQQLEKKIRKIINDIKASECQCLELENTIGLKHKLIGDLQKNKETRMNAKRKFNKKKAKLESDYEKARKQLLKVQGKDKLETQRLESITLHLESRLRDLVSMKHFTNENTDEIKELQLSLQESKNQLISLQKKLKCDRKTRRILESELRINKIKDDKKKIDGGSVNVSVDPDRANIKLKHLEKSENLNKESVDARETDSFRLEIHKLRSTREHLLDERCGLEKKFKREKLLSKRDERKLLECDEAIEAIDAAIEYKNELICGHKSINTTDRLNRERGEQMLMDRLNKLSEEEMRTLLYKYFQKVIDLRDSSRNLEMQVIALERERDAWECRERHLNNAIREARLDGERRTLLLQRQQEAKLRLMLRYLNEETTSAASSIVTTNGTNEHFIDSPKSITTITTTTTTAARAAATATSTTLSPSSIAHFNCDSRIDDFCNNRGRSNNNTRQFMNSSKHQYINLSDLCPIQTSGDCCGGSVGNEGILTSVPLGKIRVKDRERKSNILTKIQGITRSTRKIQDISIPEELQSVPLSVTKVTREKNRIIIQKDSSSRH